MCDLKGILMDLDGVIADTAELHYLAWKSTIKRLGLRFDRAINERLKGVARIHCMTIVLDANNAQGSLSAKQMGRIAEEKNLEYKRLLTALSPKDLLPGVDSFLEEVSASGIRLAVASASQNASDVLTRLKILQRFDYVSDPSRLSRQKPFPDIFLDCAHNLKLLPIDCVGIEDAQVGIEAIHAAGMFSVGVGVDVTSIKPNLVLESTHQLKLDTICKAYHTS